MGMAAIKTGLTMNARENVIDSYDALFAGRTGLTLLIQKNPVFNGGVEIPVTFAPAPDNTRDLIFYAEGKSCRLKDLKREYIDAAIQRGALMVYEMQGEDMVRCTPCHYAR